MGDERAHVELTAEDEPGNFALEGEISGITADEIFFVHANGGEIQLRVESAHLTPALSPWACFEKTDSKIESFG
jgi:hypothetical protein